MEIIKLIEGSELGVKPTLKELNIHSSTFYKWYGRYTENVISWASPSNFLDRLPKKKI